MTDADAELIAEAHRAAPLYGNDWGFLLIKLADALEARVREVGQMKTEEWLDKHFDRPAEPTKARAPERAIRLATIEECAAAMIKFFPPRWPGDCLGQNAAIAIRALARHSAPITTETLDLAQFGRVLHQRPLPEAVAGLVERLRSIKICSYEDRKDAASLIASQAREIERLTDLHMQAFDLGIRHQDRADALEARVREIEALYERDARPHRVRELEAERAAIRVAFMQFVQRANACHGKNCATCTAVVDEEIRALAKEPAS